MDTVDDLRCLIKRCRRRLDTDNPTGNLKPTDAMKYRHLLILAGEVLGIMDSQQWSPADYEHLESRFRAYVFTLSGIAWDIEGCDPRNWPAI